MLSVPAIPASVSPETTSMNATQKAPNSEATFETPFETHSGHGDLPSSKIQAPNHSVDGCHSRSLSKGKHLENHNRLIIGDSKLRRSAGRFIQTPAKSDCKDVLNHPNSVLQFIVVAAML